MFSKKFKYNKKDIIFTIIIVLITIALLLFKTNFSPNNNKNIIRAKGKVVKVDNSDLKQIGMITTGNQLIKIKILNSTLKGKLIEGRNQLVGKLEFDKIFDLNDKVLAVINYKNNKISYCNIIDHYRINWEIILILIFLIILIFYAGLTGLKAIISFIFTFIMIWKILLPGFLNGYNPLLLSILITLIITSAIIFLVAGLNKKGLIAFLGSSTGIIITCILSIIFGKLFKIHGAVKPFSESLLYSGYGHLNLNHIFLSGIFLASSGAVMDIAMDISASMNEVHKNHPEIKTRGLIKSGLNVGKVVIGTMTTTLLLAYSGSFTSMLMVFIAQQVPVINIANLNYVAAEFLHTVVGSFGLVLVAPFTAYLGGLVYKFEKKKA